MNKDLLPSAVVAEMFLKVSVHGGRGVLSAPLHAGIHIPQADTPLGQTLPPSPRWPLQRTVRILLECILVAHHLVHVRVTMAPLCKTL